MLLQKKMCKKSIKRNESKMQQTTHPSHGRQPLLMSSQTSLRLTDGFIANGVEVTVRHEVGWVTQLSVLKQRKYAF